MTRNKKLALLLFLLVTVAFAAAVGDGAATPAIRASFIQAYTRGQFSLYVNAPTAIKALGSPGLVQEFPATANTALKYALIKPDPNAPLAQFDTLQVSPDIYTPYTAVGATTAGYPTMDTAACPANGFGTCNYQFFTKNYAIFAYSEPVISTFTVADPFYSVWNTTGGLGGVLGLPTSGENAVTSISKVAGTQQTYLGGAIYTYPAGSTTAAAYSVSGAFFTAWTASGGYASLGFPTAEAALVGATGMFRQTFEAGRIEQTPGNDPGVLFPVSLVGITSASQGLSLLPGGGDDGQRQHARYSREYGNEPGDELVEHQWGGGDGDRKWLLRQSTGHLGRRCQYLRHGGRQDESPDFSSGGRGLLSGG